MMTSAELLLELKRLNIKLELDGENLRINAPKGFLTENLKHQLKQNKAQLIELLQSSREADIQALPPLSTVERKTELPLSFSQQRFWFLDQFAPGLAAYNIPLGFRIKGVLNITALRDAFNGMIARHEILRTNFVVADSDAIQRIHTDLSMEVVLIPLTDSSDTESELQKSLQAFAGKPFDLKHDPLIRANLYQTGAEEYYLAVCFHHIIFDGGSIAIFFSELLAMYNALTEGQAESLEALPLQYADFSVWQKQWSEGPIIERQLEYWKDQLSDLAGPIELPLDKVRPKFQDFAGATEQFEVSAEQVAELIELSRSEDVSLFMLLLTALKIVLYKYSETVDLCVGTPIANRSQEALQKLIGCFANTLVLRTKLDASASVRTLLSSIKSTCLDAYSNQDLPFERLVEEINPDRDTSRSPLFQVLLTYQDESDCQLSSKKLQISPDHPQSNHARTDIAIDIAKSRDGLEVVIEYASALFESATIRQMGSHFVALLTRIKGQLDKPLSEVSLLSEDEMRGIAERYDMTGRDYEQSVFLAELISRKAVEASEKTAVIASGKSVNYAELEARSNQLGRYLLKSGVSPGSLIGLCLDRSEQMLIALLGILKAGCAYVPMDPEYPTERLHYMAQDAGIKYLITQQSYANLFTDVDKVFDIQELQKTLPELSSASLDISISSDTIAYVIYTSGSTGKPKGVMVPHGAVSNFLQSMLERPGLNQEDRLLAVTTLSFDIAVLELYLPLIGGGTVVIAGREEA